MARTALSLSLPHRYYHYLPTLATFKIIRTQQNSGRQSCSTKQSRSIDLCVKFIFSSFEKRQKRQNREAGFLIRLYGSETHRNTQATSPTRSAHSIRCGKDWICIYKRALTPYLPIPLTMVYQSTPLSHGSIHPKRRLNH